MGGYPEALSAQVNSLPPFLCLTEVLINLPGGLRNGKKRRRVNGRIEKKDLPAVSEKS
jgi:hypothetical protein